MVQRFSIGLVLALAVVAAAPLARAQDGDSLAVAVELEAGAQVAISNSAQLAEQDPPFLMTVAGGFYPSRSVRLAIEGHFDLEDDSRRTELSGTATYFLDLRVVEVFAGLGVGRYWRDLDGPMFSDQGFIIGIDAGARFGLVGPISASVLVGHTIAESQHGNPVWAQATQVGAALSLKL